jgi:hypothetical protein
VYRLDYGKTFLENAAGRKTTWEEKRFIFIVVTSSLIFSYVLFVSIRSYLLKGKPTKTHTEEWRRASEEYLRSHNANPISGNVRQGP